MWVYENTWKCAFFHIQISRVHTHASFDNQFYDVRKLNQLNFDHFDIAHQASPHSHNNVTFDFHGVPWGGRMSLKVTARHTCSPLKMQTLLSKTLRGPDSPKTCSLNKALLACNHKEKGFIRIRQTTFLFVPHVLFSFCRWNATEYSGFGFLWQLFSKRQAELSYVLQSVHQPLQP